MRKRTIIDFPLEAADDMGMNTSLCMENRKSYTEERRKLCM